MYISDFTEKMELYRQKSRLSLWAKIAMGAFILLLVILLCLTVRYVTPDRFGVLC